jgi:hypothetical protein
MQNTSLDDENAADPSIEKYVTRGSATRGARPRILLQSAGQYARELREQLVVEGSAAAHESHERRQRSLVGDGLR